jgi:hypothetical protein
MKLGQCDGNRPSCGHCMKKGAICEYDVDPGVTRLETMRRKNDFLQREVDQLRELFDYIRTCPEVEAKQVYRQLRTANGLQDLIHLRGGSDISSKQKHRMSGSENPAYEPDSDVLANSAIRVPARPWTLLAGDDLVSELVSAFFTYDHCSGIPFVDQECFLADMRAGNIVQARFCSPLLVNAICALKCVSVRIRIAGNSLTIGTIVYIRAG